MAAKKRKSSARSGGVRTVYRSAPKKKKRRTSTLNRSVKKPMQTIGTVVGLATVYGPSVIQSVKTMNAQPVLGAVMSKDYAIEAAKRVAIGFVAGTAAGVVADKTGLKRPVNKVLRLGRGLI